MTVSIPKRVSIHSRKKARRLALQGVYEWSLTNHDPQEIEAWLIENYSNKRLDQDYLSKVLTGVPSVISELDKTFSPFLDRPIERLEQVELAVLRLATYELLYLTDIPCRVVINEALELSKTFGSVEGFKYVNGILDPMVKALGKSTE